MNTTKTLFTVLAAAVALAGCGGMSFPSAGPAAPAAPAGEAEHLRAAGIADEGDDGPSPVDEARQWRGKYLQASEELTKVEADTQTLHARQQELLAAISALQSESASLTRRRDRAEGLTIQVRRDVDRWETNVRTFHAEMQRARKARMAAIIRILELVGRQPVAPEAPPQTAKAPTP